MTKNKLLSTLLADIDFYKMQLPDPTRHIGGLFTGILEAVGVDLKNSFDYAPLDFGLFGGSSKASPYRSALLVVIDGLGVSNLEARRGHAPFLKNYQHILSSTCPSTTASALTTIGTGFSPARTAMMSYALRDENGKSFSIINWRDTQAIADEWQNLPTLAQVYAVEEQEVYEQQVKTQLRKEPQGVDKANFELKGLPIYSVGEPKFIDSGLTLAAFRGIKQFSAKTFEQRAELALRLLREKPCIVYLYAGDLDKAGHHNGWQSNEWIASLESIDAILARVAKRLPEKTIMAISADHGMVDVSARFDLASFPEVASLITLVSGEERGLHIYTSLEKVDLLKQNLQARIADKALIFTRKEIIASGLLGTSANGQIVPVRKPQALGDLVIFAAGRYVFSDSRFCSPAAMRLRGVHGSLTTEEMQVPLIVVTRP